MAWTSEKPGMKIFQTSTKEWNSREICYQTNAAAGFKNKDPQMDCEMTANCNMVIQ